MKVRLAVVVDVNPVYWTAEYGIGPDEPAVHADVVRYLQNHIMQAPAVGEVLGLEVTVR